MRVLTCDALFRAAAQEWFEIGDIWHRVTQLRPDPRHNSTDAEHHPDLAHQLRTLLTYDTHPTGPLFGPHGPLTTLRPWAETFHNAGEALATAEKQPSLPRGLRSISAHHVIFHWNRLGLDITTQHTLAHAATTAILHTDPTNGAR